MMKTCLMLSSILCLALVSGCSEKSTVKEESKVTTPGGTTTISVEKDVKKTGDHKTP